MLCNFYLPNTKHMMFRVGVRMAFVLALLLASLLSQANATTWREALPEAELVGEGDLRWFGLRIYSAKLWRESGAKSTNAASINNKNTDAVFTHTPFALELTYHRSISREQFVSTSIKEIKRLFGSQYSAEILASWQREMEAAFTDVNAGDQLIGVFQPNQGCQFYSHSTLLADIRDPEFAKAFFAIWFDPRSKDKGLREKLLGNRS